MEHFVYRGPKTSQISFPLGGIGSGSIGLAGNGRLIDWEIFNRPNKGSVNGFSHFAIRAEDDTQVKAARILHGDLQSPYMGEFNKEMFRGFGWGPRREYLTGLPHFPSVDFRGQYPMAELTFHDDSFPGQVQMLAFNPLIPTNDDDSSMPAAFFEISVTNTQDTPLNYTLVGVLANPLPANNINRVHHHDWGQSLRLTSANVSPDAIGFGDLTLATDAGQDDDIEISWQQYWYRGTWFDNLEVYWHDLNKSGPFKNRTYSENEAGAENQGLLAVHMPVSPGETRRVRFVITWNFPNCENYWKQLEPDAPRTWKNHYASLWSDSTASAQYALENWNRLYTETERFRSALFASDLPPAAIDAISANISLLKSPTVLRLEDGTFYGWEGCHPTAGCCEGSCTHVWNYAQALPFLFPALERSMRDADYTYNVRDDGGMTFRLQLPLGSPRSTFRPCADGQFGGVMKAYRDWKICGDTEWLRKLWPEIKASIEFAWHPDNIDQWDPDKTGVLWGRQHHTLDMELFGPNSWLSGFYLGALKAGAEMASHLGDSDAAEEYAAIFERGKAWVDEHLFNGEYYIQQIDLSDKSILETYTGDDNVLRGRNVLDAYWSEEHGQIKYQLSEGSSIDQVVGQWHASLYGLGDIHDPEQTKKASAAIYDHNFIPVMRDVYNPCRIYCLNDEGGLVICAWPEGADKPVIPAPYSQETMNGFEYSAAIHMIMTGQIDKGMTCIEAIRNRYDGERRNPWNEFECGSNYARSMAAYALLNAFSGFEFDLVQHRLGFNPIQFQHDSKYGSGDGHFRCFWSLDSGWGEVEIAPDQVELRVLYGDLALSDLHLPFLDGKTVEQVTVGDDTVSHTFEDGVVSLNALASISPDSPLRVTVSV